MEDEYGDLIHPDDLLSISLAKSWRGHSESPYDVTPFYPSEKVAPWEQKSEGPLTPKEPKMENQNTLNLMYAEAGHAVVQVLTQLEQKWDYLVPLDDTYLEHDRVIVTAANSSCQIGTVTAVFEAERINFTSDIQYRWVIGRVNDELISSLEEREQTFLKALSRATAKKRLEEALGEMSPELLAIISPEKEDK